MGVKPARAYRRMIPHPGGLGGVLILLGAWASGQAKPIVAGLLSEKLSEADVADLQAASSRPREGFT